MTEQDILANAPEGAEITFTICEDKQRLYADNLEMLANGCATFWTVYGEEFDPDGRCISFNDDLQSLSDISRIAELEKALKSTNAELSGAIDQVNHFFEYHHPSNSLDEPENWDKQTCFENQVLLKEQGE